LRRDDDRLGVLSSAGAAATAGSGGAGAAMVAGASGSPGSGAGASATTGAGGGIGGGSGAAISFRCSADEIECGTFSGKTTTATPDVATASSAAPATQVRQLVGGGSSTGCDDVCADGTADAAGGFSTGGDGSGAIGTGCASAACTASGGGGAAMSASGRRGTTSPSVVSGGGTIAGDDLRRVRSASASTRAPSITRVGVSTNSSAALATTSTAAPSSSSLRSRDDAASDCTSEPSITQSTRLCRRAPWDYARRSPGIQRCYDARMTPRPTLLVAAAAAAAALTVAHPLRADARGTALMVLYFDNNTGNKDLDNLSKGLADMMITDLSSVSSLTIVEREKLEAILKELKLQRTKYFDPKTAQRIGKGAGAAYVVSGAFLSVAPDMRLDVRVIKLETGTVVKSATVTGQQQKFFELQQKLTAQLVDGLSEVLSKSDADKARAAAAENRVDNAQTLVDYGKGLEARDSGDLQTASQLMQQVVAKSPDWKLGKARYMEIMKELYAAKSRRSSLLSDSEQRLLDHIAAELKKGSAASSKRTLAYRILNGQYHLNRFASNPKRPAAEIRDHLKAYVDNQLVLINETKGMGEYPFGSAAISSEDTKLAEELGVKMPGSTFSAKTPAEVMRRLHAVLMFGEPSTFDVNVMPTDRVCYSQLDPSYPKIAFSMMDLALDHLAKHERRYRERESMRALREYAQGLVAAGRPEEAIAKLQSGLTQFPKSDEFNDTEKMLREILAGQKPGWGCKPPK